MDHLPLTVAAAAPPPQVRTALDAYKKALATAASVTAYAMLMRSMARELLPDELRVAVRWAAALMRARFGRVEKLTQRPRLTIVIKQQYDRGYGENHLFDSARTYLASKVDPRAMTRLCLTGWYNHDKDGSGRGSSSWTTQLHMEPGASTTDVFDGVEFTWASVEIDGTGASAKKQRKGGGGGGGGGGECLELSFDAEHTETVLERYVPFVMATAEDMERKDRPLRIYMNEGSSWHGISHHHPATFDTMAMDPELKQSMLADLDRFLKRKDYYRRIGKAWKRGYLLYGPPGTGKSTLVAAMANYLRFSLYDLDLSMVQYNSVLQGLLIAMPNKSILVVEDIDCCFDAMSREGDDADGKAPEPNDGLESGNPSSYTSYGAPAAVYPARGRGSLMQMQMQRQLQLQMRAAAMAASYHTKSSSSTQGITLSGLLNFIDGLWSTSGEERIIVFTTNYKNRLDPALLRPGRMDMHIHMGYCGWEAFKMLAKNYFLIDNHQWFPEILEMLSQVEVTPAEVSEMLLRSEDVDVALRVLIEFLQEKRQMTMKESEDKEEDAAEEEMQSVNLSFSPKIQ